MRPLKIALLSRWYWEETRRYGDSGGMVRQVAEAVAALGHEVVVLTQNNEVTSLEKSKIGPLEIWLSPRDKRRDFLTGLRDKWAKQSYGHRKAHSDTLDLRDFLAQRGPFDLLWAQCEEPDGLVAAVAARSGVKLPPLLTQIHSLRYRFENGAVVFTGKPALGLAFKHADRIIANSELVASCVPEYASVESKVRVVYPNLVRDFLTAAEELSPAPVTGRVRVLFLGALNEKKGALTFLEAIQKSEAAKAGTVFTVIGGFTEKNPDFSGRWTRLLRETQAKLAPAQLGHLGQLSPFEVIREIKLARVVVLPSLFDEFSRALVEALILGRPVITTDRVGAWPLVEKNECGLVIPPNDPVALARAIDAAVDPAAPYAERAQHIAHRLLHEFSPEAIARQLAHHFSELAG